MRPVVMNRKTLLSGFLALLVAGGMAVASAADGDKKKPVPPPTKKTQVIRAETYKKMEVAQKAFEAKDYKGAIVALDELKSAAAKLNDYERATLYNLYAAVYYAQDKTPQAIQAYQDVLKQPNLPEGLRDSSLYSMAQLHFIAENYPKAIQVIKKWLSVVAEPSPEGYALLAQAHYQMQNYAEAEKALTTSLKISKKRGQEAKESALALLRAIYYERKDYAKAARVLEVLVTNHPDKSTYWQQLAGMRGLMDQQRQQLLLLHAAYKGRLLTRELELLNLARLYMVQDAPYAAVTLLAAGMKDKMIDPNSDNLQLYAQALAMAKEFERQIPALKKLAEMTGEARHYVYLGQVYNELGDWEKAAVAFESALKGKDLKDAGGVRIQLGTAQFNAGRLSEARRTFIAASESAENGETAANWIKFVSSEIERKKVLSGKPGTPASQSRDGAPEESHENVSSLPGAMEPA